MKKLIDVEYFCEKCDKNLIGKLLLDMPEELFDEAELKRVREYFKQIHKSKEHTHCAKCGKKIQVGIDPKETWGVQIVGKSFDKPTRPGDTGFKIWTAIFCKKCIEEIEKDKAKPN